MNSELRAIVYTRVSTEEQAVNNTSLQDQRERGLRACEYRHALPVKVCEDAGISGARYDERPALMEALALIDSGAADLLIVTKIDRLARKASIALKIAERIDRAGAQIVTCDGMEFGKTAIGRLMLTQLAAMAEFERDTFRERAMSGKVRRALEGVQPSRSRSPYGYAIVTRADREHGRFDGHAPGEYVIVEQEAVWVRRMYERFDEGASLRSIARFLTDRSAPTRYGAETWSASSVRSILGNPIFRGEASFGRYDTVSRENMPWLRDAQRVVKSGTRHVVKAQPTVVFDAPAIVDTELWNRCSARLKSSADEKKAQHGGNPDRKYALTGLVFCPDCGRRMFAHKHRTRGIDRGAFFQCRKDSRCPSGPSKTRTFQEAVLNRLAVGAVLHLAEHPATVADAIRAYDAHKRQTADPLASDSERARLSARLAEINAGLTATRRAMIEALKVGMREEDFLPDLEQMATERRRVESSLSLLADPPTPKPTLDARTAAEKIAAVAEAVKKVLTADAEDFSPAEKQALLARIIEAVVPTEEGAEIRVKSDTVHSVKAVFQGHTHVVEEITYLGVRYITGGAVCGDWWKGPRLGVHPEGFVVATVTGDDLAWKYVPYGWKAKSS